MGLFKKLFLLLSLFILFAGFYNSYQKSAYAAPIGECETSANCPTNQTCINTLCVNRYSCNGNSCILKRGGSFTTSTCNNTCSPFRNTPCEEAGFRCNILSGNCRSDEEASSKSCGGTVGCCKPKSTSPSTDECDGDPTCKNKNASKPVCKDKNSNTSKCVECTIANTSECSPTEKCDSNKCVPKGTTAPPPDNGQCKDDRRVKPTVKAQGDVQKTGELNGDYFEKIFTFKVSNKNPTNAQCGKRDYQLQAIPATASWGPNPPSFEFRSPIVDGKVLDVGPGNSRDQLKVFVRIFKTTPAGNYNFSIKAQDTEDSGSTRMSDNLQFRFVVPQGGSTACTSDAQCSASSPKCKVSTGACVECLTNTDCSEDGQICTNNACVDEDGGTGSGGKIHLRLGMDGIGTTGTLQEPSCKFTANPPTDKERSVTLKLTSNTAPVTLDATARYSDYTRAAADACPPATKTDKGKFVADIDLPAGFTSKNYSVDIASGDSPNLHQIKENFAINASSQNTLEADLPAGDIDKDSDPELRIDINDWNILRTCQRKNGNPASCAVGATTYKTDLDDDGKTDADDMTLFIQEFFYRNR